MGPKTRTARPEDADALCRILNPIIAEGSTTGHRRLFDNARMRSHYIAHPDVIRCTLVELDAAIVGFQVLIWADPNWDGPGKLPQGWAVIASFVRPGLQGKGLGQALWHATKQAAKSAGVIAIDATIRADNTPGLAFYSGLGFVDYATQTGVSLSDGTMVDKVQKRFDLC